MKYYHFEFEYLFLKLYILSRKFWKTTQLFLSLEDYLNFEFVFITTLIHYFIKFSFELLVFFSNFFSADFVRNKKMIIIYINVLHEF